MTAVKSIACTILALPLLFLADWQTCHASSNWGRKFTIVFLEQYSHHIDGDLELHIVAQESGTVDTVCTPSGVAKTTSVNAGSTTKVAVDANSHLTDGRSINRCVVTSNVNISIVVVDTVIESGWLSVDGFLVLPDSAMSTEYMVASYRPASDSNRDRMAVLCLDLCSVNITLPRNASLQSYNGQTYSPGSTITLSLDHESYQMSNTGDLSGAIVKSSSPVAVYSGSDCANVPFGVDTCDFLVEQMIPTDTWGRHFIVPGIYPRTTTIVRIFAKEILTTFTIHTQATSYTISVNASFHELRFNDAELPVAIIADRPAMVVEYSTSDEVDHTPGGPFMSIVPAVEHYASEKVAFAESSSLYDHLTVAVIIETNEIRFLTINGFTANKYTTSVPAPLSQYSVVYMNASSPTSELSVTPGASTSNIKFAAMLYSVDSRDKKYGYGFPLGIRFPLPAGPYLQQFNVQVNKAIPGHNDLIITGLTIDDCAASCINRQGWVCNSFEFCLHTGYCILSKLHPDTQPGIVVNSQICDLYSRIRQSTTSPQPPTTSPYVPLPTPTANMTGSTNALSCFACEDVSELKYCDTIQTCNTGEICFVSTFTTPDGHRTYRSGCTKQTTCSLAGKKRAVNGGSTGSPCLSCCSSNFCNFEGCGDQGYGSRSNRGPVCLDCSHVGQVSKCDQATLCRSNELCSIEEYHWGDTDRQYRLGCKGNVLCATGGRRSAVVLHERSVPVCHACCTGDFCNRNCTTSSVIPGPIG